MEFYTTDEQRLEHLKQWWQKYGNILLAALAIASMLTLAWHYWQQHQMVILEHASMRYEQLLTSAANDDSAAVNEHAQRLLTHYQNTPYAQLAALMLARQAVYQQQFDEALKQLRWVMDHGNNAALKQVARLRMARLLLAQKKADQALATLNKVDEPTYLAAIEEVKGDIFMAQGKTSYARDAYAKAKQAIPNMESSRPILRMKLDDIPAQNSKLP
jgi:predicted negative regulator of RcsB-dependent stress response